MSKSGTRFCSPSRDQTKTHVGAPIGNRNRLSHGHHSRESIAMRKRTKALARDIPALLRLAKSVGL
jgi:hypothetical protein